MKMTKHGLRHGQKISGFTVDTKSDSDWVYLLRDGCEVIRQRTHSSGRVFSQGSNPDYQGRESYRLQYAKDSRWYDYDSQARIGAIRLELKRLADITR